MAVIAAKDFISELLTMWNISTKGVRSVNIHLAYDDIVKVTVERFAHNDDMDKLKTFMENYALTRIDNPMNVTVEGTMEDSYFADKKKYKGGISE